KSGATGAPGANRAERLRAWNRLDWELYSHAKRRFWERAESFGMERLGREVARLRQRRERLARECLRGGGPVPGGEIPDGMLRPFQPPGGAGKVLGFALRSDLQPEQRERCARLATPELQYKDLLERRQ
ncbi:G3ST4 sulfotransferase, partial [Sclerurus mexicanus]|nr:G3ST4 sulfotransferase [Sclerurus mexicanus]